MLRADPTCASDNLLLAAGILSAPQHAERRSAQRRTWLSYPNVGRSAPICPLFVVRSGGLERWHRQRHKLEREIRTLWRPAAHASGRAQREPRARPHYRSPSGSSTRRSTLHAAYIAKVDDDTHLHTPDLERLLRLGQRELGATANTMVGVLTFYSWIPDQFKARAHGWSFGQAQKGSGRASRTWTQRSCEWTAAWDPSRSRLATSSRYRRRSLLKLSTRAVRAPMPIASSGRTQRDAKLAPTASAAREVWCWRTCGSAPCSTAGRRRLR